MKRLFSGSLDFLKNKEVVVTLVKHPETESGSFHTC